MSLRHRVSNEVAKGASGSSKAFFPVVTASIAPPLPATLKECYPENQDLSLTFEELDMFGNSSGILSSRRLEFDGYVRPLFPLDHSSLLSLLVSLSLCLSLSVSLCLSLSLYVPLSVSLSVSLSLLSLSLSQWKPINEPT
jgi:hypothetical protein